jgi:hypothetical protein
MQLLQNKHFTSPLASYFNNLFPVERQSLTSIHKRKACFGIAMENQISLLLSTLGCFTRKASQESLLEYLLEFEANHEGVSLTPIFTKGNLLCMETKLSDLAGSQFHISTYFHFIFLSLVVLLHIMVIDSLSFTLNICVS